MQDETDDFARRLRELTPASTKTRDQLLFEAGRAAGRREERPWRIAAAVLMVAILGLSFAPQGDRRDSLADKGSGVPVEARQATAARPVQVDRSEEPPTAAQSIAAALDSRRTSYLQSRDFVLRWGVDGLPTASLRGAPRNGESARSSGAPAKSGDENETRSWWQRRMQQMGGFES